MPNVSGEEMRSVCRIEILRRSGCLEQFLLALKVQGFGAITLSGSVLESPVLQAAFCKAPSEKLVAWITIGTPAEGVTFAPETGEAPLSVWY